MLPNLLVAGATDQAGDEASFSSYGKTVLVDADGYHVDSTVPGGHHVELSGTSMSAPMVTNLAAKLIALDPSLTPQQTIALIRAGATHECRRPHPQYRPETVRGAAAQTKKPPGRRAASLNSRPG